MKKIFIYTLLIIISTSLNSCKGQNNQPTEVTIDYINYYLTQNLTATVIKGNYNGNISIPENVKYQGQSYTVQEVGYGAFENSKELISVKLPTTIKIIGGRAFENCENLKSVNIPSSVESIQQAVFFKCRMIKTIDIPENVESIGEYAFSYCESLESITVDKNNKYFSS
ncbi:MAG: leucine-rich repeat domain-containing protein, partial [Niabella sp.]